MGVSGMEGVDVNSGTRLLGSGPGAIAALAFSSLSALGRYTYKNFSLPTDGKNRVSPALNFTVTPLLFPVYVCPLSAATLRERRWQLRLGT